MTFGERRKQVDLKAILKDMDAIESAFLTSSQKLNKKRLELLEKKMNKLIPQLESAKGTNEFEAFLTTISLPSHKEYGKLISKLIHTSASLGSIRANEELKYLRGKYQFAENVFPEVIGEAVIEAGLTPEAQTALDEYAMQITAITESTVVEAIKRVLSQEFNAGLTPQEIATSVMETAGSWMSPSYANTIARTEMSKMYNSARLARYTSEENKGFVVALQYDAIIDTRTTKVCRHLDGLIIDIKRKDLIAEYSPPNHFQCRSVWLPVTKFETWEDNWSTSEKPEKGFAHSAPNLAVS
ncbi:phage head morphogenesis protein [Bacillus wiedmannii]|uniref:phage head morphogenesis protein n=1 Tax=Bacillus wiedmannii TaxID=1890302 RepID=UPI00211D26E3|nr:phage head morphogenesis protein [Bacillus wiedmannii]